MAISTHQHAIVDGNDGTLAGSLRAAIARRTGEFPQDAEQNTELTALGIDSLLLLRIVADVVVDPSLEIDVAELGDLVTVADLERFLDALTSGS